MEKQQSRYLGTLTAAFVAVLLISNVAALKVFALGGFVFDGGALIFPVSYIFGDVLTEVYGYAVCRRIIWTGFFWLLVYNLIMLACVALPPEADWQAHVGQDSFRRVFDLSPRLVAGGVLGFFWGEFANSYVLARLKTATRGRHLWVRTIGSTVVGEFVDTGIFCLVAFAGILSAGKIWNYTLTGYVYKTVVEIVMTPVTYKVVAFLKRREGLDCYNEDENFSPFRW